MLMLFMNTISYVAGYRKTAYSANSVAVLAQDGNGMLLLYIVQLIQSFICACYGPITIAIRARFERDTTSYEELCAFEQ